MLERAQVRVVPVETAAVQITAASGRPLLRLKSWLPEHAAGEKLTILGRELPSQVGSTTLCGSMRVLCVGPAEWLIVSLEHAGSNLREHFESETSRQGLALVDLTDGFVGLKSGVPLPARCCPKDVGSICIHAAFRLEDVRAHALRSFPW